ncbi:cytochrome P450 4C1 isoform X1 [Plutella xylostella]|uniref:cytochrome P450 4C1 isoform X1 n=1 Tax=Plutella xylostella TaxID=51655 RepID=UPI0020328559|nr:cytochrome P450 4C1 isoform X1 [Plutella xylostella]
MMLLVHLVVLRASVFLLRLLISLLYRRHCASKLPCVSGALPLIGHLHKISTDKVKLFDFIIHAGKETDKHGGLSTVWFGPIPIFILMDPDIAFSFLNSCVKKSYVYSFGSAWIGEGLVSAMPATWRRHRKLLNPSFNLQVLHGFLDIFNRQSARLVDKLGDVVGQEQEGTTHVESILLDIGLDTICETAFGISNKNRTSVVAPEYKDAVGQMLDYILQRFMSVWMHWDVLYNVSSLKKKADEACHILNKTSTNILQEVANSNSWKGNDNLSGKSYKTILEFLLKHKEESELTDKEIKDEVDTMVIAGFDTTATQLLYAFILLGSHPDVQERIYNEIKEVLGDMNRDVTKDDLPKLVYIEAVIKETLRLYPVIPMIIRETEQTMKLSKYTIPAGSTFVVPIYGMNRSQAWGPDRDVFNPDRWFTPAMLPENLATYAPFSMGKRGCIGKPYALMSMKTTLVHVLRKYRLSANHDALRVQMDLLLKPTSGHEVTITRRD